MQSLTSSSRRLQYRSNSGSNSWHYRARYYDQNAGRFISEDPIAFEGGSNFYTYVRNRPTALTDPAGLLKFDPSCNCSGGFNRQQLQLADQLAQAAASNITDIGLRDCVQDKLKNGKAKCGGGDCDKKDNQGRITVGWAPPFGKTIHLCKSAGNSEAGGSDLLLACTMVHEAAHTCGHPREGAPNRAEAQAFGGICPNK